MSMTFFGPARRQRTVASARLGAVAAVLAGMFVATVPASAQDGAVTLRGRVVHVEDGDTLTMQIGSDRYVVRLADIDAPETCHRYRDPTCTKPGQRWGEMAREVLHSRAYGEEVTATCAASSYGRTVCRVVKRNGVDVAEEVARVGFAWYHPRFVQSERIRQLVDAARAARTGLWKDDSPIEPWVWRRSCWERGQCPGGVR